jgi:hypothetical protein
MNIAIVGAAGSCGRQLAAQLLDRRLLPASARLQLVGHRSGRSADELWGLRADLEDAFVDDAPTIEVVLEPSAIDADLWRCSPAPPSPLIRTHRLTVPRWVAPIARCLWSMQTLWPAALGSLLQSLFNPTR